MAYKFKLWTGVRYGIDTMTNDMKEAKVLDKTEYSTYKMLNILGIV